MRKVIRFLDVVTDRILTLFLLLVLLIGIWFIYDTAYVFYHASAGRVAAFRPNSEGPGDTVMTKTLTEDYVAWLRIDDSSIDYPVMQGDNNSKYLNTDPYGEYSLAGSIFLDSRNASDFSDSYSLIYGHHMQGGYMFGALDRYYDEAYYEAHRSGTLTVGEKVFPLRAFAVLKTDANEYAIFTPQGSEIVLALAEESALYASEPESEHILALSTCVDASSTTRTVVLFSILDDMATALTEGSAKDGETAE